MSERRRGAASTNGSTTPTPAEIDGVRGLLDGALLVARCQGDLRTDQGGLHEGRKRRRRCGGGDDASDETFGAVQVPARQLGASTRDLEDVRQVLVRVRGGHSRISRWLRRPRLARELGPHGLADGDEVEGAG
jgi:hypothetical protein